MLSVLTTWLLAGWSKARVYFFVLFAGAALVAAIIWRVFAAGAASEKLHNAQATIRQYEKEARIEADIHSLSADAARERLRSKWRKR